MALSLREIYRCTGLMRLGRIELWITRLSRARKVQFRAWRCF